MVGQDAEDDALPLALARLGGLLPQRLSRGAQPFSWLGRGTDGLNRGCFGFPWLLPAPGVKWPRASAAFAATKLPLVGTGSDPCQGMPWRGGGGGSAMPAPAEDSPCAAPALQPEPAGDLGAIPPGCLPPSPPPRVPAGPLPQPGTRLPLAFLRPRQGNVTCWGWGGERQTGQGHPLKMGPDSSPHLPRR